MNEYPSRVTLYDDGVYRWSYDMDMWHNRYLLRILVKAVTLFCVAVLLVLLALLGPRYLNATTLGVCALIVVGMYLIPLGVYAICALAMHGTYHLCFQMDESAVALVQSAGTKRRNRTLGVIATVVGLAAAKRPGEVLRVTSTLAMANAVGTTAFSSVTRVKLHPEDDVIDLREWFGLNQIYVGREDYAFVRDFILERVREKARR